MNIEKINLKAGESVKVTVDNYEGSQVPLEWDIIQGGIQLQHDLNDFIKKSAVLTDQQAGESIIAVTGTNRCVLLLINTFDIDEGDLTVVTS